MHLTNNLTHKKPIVLQYSNNKWKLITNQKNLYLAYLEYTCVQYLRDGMNKSYPIIFRNTFTNKIPVILSNSKKRVLIWVEGKKTTISDTIYAHL